MTGKVEIFVGCVREEESEHFNEFLKEMRSCYEGKRRDDFYQMLVQKEVTLISYDESVDSSVSPDDAKKVNIILTW